jgi:hypothetical protein
VSTDGNQTGPVDEMGPIDFLVVELPGARFAGEGLPLLVGLADRGTIRILDLVFIKKGQDGSVARLRLEDLEPEQRALLAVFEGASSGLLNQEDLDATGAVIAPGSAAGVLVYENRWAAPLAVALRRGGAQLVANGRIPVQGLLAALDAAEAADAAATSAAP